MTVRFHGIRVRPEPSATKRAHVDRRLSVQDIERELTVLQPALRRAHAELYAVDGRPPSGELQLAFRVQTNGEATLTGHEAPPDLIPLVPVISSAITRTKFPRQVVPMRVELRCTLGGESALEADPFGMPWAASTEADSGGFGDPF